MSIDAMASATKAIGSQTALARALGCTPQNVQWMCSTGSIPAKHVLKIEEATGVSRHRLRPDLYPESSSALSQMMLEETRPDQSVDPSVHPYSAHAGVPK
ncbi:transcriptional regulator [Pseudomonas sp.]|uniref:transcriptional regulator n=1 Tax=Pseudomonas sp. TaxID=306 RepID=UPI003C79AE15